MPALRVTQAAGLVLLVGVASCLQAPDTDAPALPFAEIVPTPSPDRLEVTDRLRAACANYAPRDVDIKALLLAWETDRLNGMTRNQAMQLVSAVCHSFVYPYPIVAIECSTCSVAITDQIYGP